MKESHRLGEKGEKRAAAYLRRRGYRILQRNFTSGKYEIDLIASKGDCIVFVEVKTRTADRDDPVFRPADAVTKEKQIHVRRCAAAYLKTHPSEKRKRFDVMEVYVGKRVLFFSPVRIVHIESAF